MFTQELTSTNTVQALSVTSEKGQYTLWQLLGSWASAALPMGLIYWVVMPTVSTNLTIEPGFVFYVLITLGLVWQGVLAVLMGLV